MNEDDDLQAWLDEASADLAKEAAERKERARRAPRWTWDEMQFNFKVEQFRRAIGA